MTGWLRLMASAGVFLAFAAVGVFLAVALFGDRFIRSDERLRKLMDAVLYLTLAALALVSFVAAVLAYRA